MIGVISSVYDNEPEIVYNGTGTYFVPITQSWQCNCQVKDINKNDQHNLSPQK